MIKTGDRVSGVRIKNVVLNFKFLIIGLLLKRDLFKFLSKQKYYQLNVRSVHGAAVIQEVEQVI